MDIIDCSIGEKLNFGDDIRISLTGRIDEVLYVYIDAASAHELEAGDGFHASAPCRIGYSSHVLALRSHDSFQIGPVRVQIADVLIYIDGAQALRDVRLRVHTPKAMACVRHRYARGADGDLRKEGVTC
jgi:hypothetical protein